MRATLAIALAILTGITSLGITQSGVLASSKSAAHPPCSITYVVGKPVCYYPAQAGQAEHGLNFAYRPSAQVQQLLHLRLAQVITVRMQPTRIQYIYGHLVPGGDYGRAPSSPPSIVISEDRGISSLDKHFLQRACGMTVMITPATGNPYHKAPAYGPWWLVAHVPRRSATLQIMANISLPTVKQLACNILRAA